jgi:DNA repair protein RadC
MLRHGAGAVSDSELLAILLRTGLPGRPALTLAGEILSYHGSLAGLVGATPADLRRLSLGPARAAAVLAALELGCRLARATLPERDPMHHPEAVVQYLALRFCTPGQEIMGALFLDTRNRLIAAKELYRGTLSRAAVEPRAVLKEGLLRDAAGFVLFHTHPSGDPSPSAEDLAFTRRIAQSGELLGLRLVDHLIVGSVSSWTSLRQRGGW